MTWVPVNDDSTIPLDWGFIAHFDRSEFSEWEKMQPKLIRALDIARERAGVPFVLTSTYRDGDDGAHGRGWAVDIRAHDSTTRYRVVWGAIKAGFTRIGVYDKHIHLDLDPLRDPQVMWWGESQ